jgi:prepilin-type processing-associated H-X9-DG protein
MFAARPGRAVAAAFAALPLLAACSSGSSSLPAPAPLASTTLLTRLGADTIAIEQYTRTPTHMEGVLVSRVPTTRVARYSVGLAANGAPTRADYSVRNGDGTPIPGELQSLSVRYGQDSVYVVGHRSAGDTARAFGARGQLLPYTSNSYGLYELAFTRLLAAPGDSIQFALVPMSLDARTTTPLAMKRIGADSVRIDFFGNPLFARHDGRGGVLWLDGSRTTLKVRVDRVADAGIQGLAKEWALRETVSAPVGSPSTRDTVTATVGNAHVWIDYGRPALRGRNVWTNGVLGDTLWRTGANAATQLRSDVDLVVGGAVVPAGTYTLWTAATANGYRLVINKQFGQWGTAYDPKRDLVRVPLRESSVGEPVERFTIAIQPQGTQGGILTLTWGTKQLSVPFSTR